MERLTEKLTTARKALGTLKELLSRDSITTVERDAAIQRFEHTFEAVWKAAKLYLFEIEGLDIGSPKGVIRGFFQTGLLSEAQTELALGMVDDRNLTAHTYDETLAEKIFTQLNTYAKLMDNWLDAMEQSRS